MVDPTGRQMSRLPLFIALIGLVITVAVAQVRSESDAMATQLVFEAETTRVASELAGAVHHFTTTYRAGVNFVEATHPGPVDQYEDFFLSESPFVDSRDPGVMVIEVVAPDDLDGLVVRERNQGRKELQLAVTEPTDGNHYILTRATREVDVFGFPIRGVDLGPTYADLFPEGIAENDITLQFVVPNELLTGLGYEGKNADDPYVAILAAPVGATNPGYSGYVIRLLKGGQLFGNTPNTLRGSGLNFAVYAPDVNGPVFRAGDTDGADPSTGSLISRRRLKGIDPVELDVVVFAGPGFGPDTGLATQRTVWLTGFLITLLCAGALTWRNNHRRRVEDAESQLRTARLQAHTDPLTGLLNRQGLIDQARHPARIGRLATVFFIDLDGFKTINDTRGHDAGDRVLRAVADRLRSTFRADDLLCRLGGDEFVVVTERVHGPAEIEAVAERVTRAIDAIERELSGSIGLAVRAPGSGNDIKDLIRMADKAMYEAKRTGGNRYALAAEIVEAAAPVTMEVGGD